ncbi:MAG TPA: SAM-dependent methyltransferase, partial [Actinomycetota bacterium]
MTDRDAAADALAGRIFGAVLETFDIYAVYIGDRLGYYRALATDPLTSTELATRTGTAERYAREWLEQQAVTGILVTDDRVVDALARRYALPAAHVGPLTDALGPSHFAPFVQFVVGC